MGELGAGLSRQPVGAILAGGRATRLGGLPKGLLEVGGRRIIDRVADTLSAITRDLLLVANAEDAARWLPGARVVRDTLTGGGSAAGVHAALRAAAGPVIVAAWDLPFVNVASFAQMAAAGDEAVVDAVVFEGTRPGNLEPLCGWYAPPCADAIEREWTDGDRSLHALLRRVRVLVLPAPREGRESGLPVFFNVNTESDLAQARAMAADAGDARDGPA